MVMGLSCDWPNPGAYRTDDFAGVPILTVRGRDGTLRAFLNVELPMLWPGMLGSATFSIIVSFNETVRTALVQGPLNTVQTYIWSRFLQVGLTPPTYALMSVMILLTAALILATLLASLRRSRRP